MSKIFESALKRLNEFSEQEDSEYYFYHDLENGVTAFCGQFTRDFSMKASVIEGFLDGVESFIISKEHTAVYERAYAEIFANTRDDIDIKMSIRDELSSDIRRLHLTGTCERDEEGVARAVKGTISDITRQKHGELHSEELKSLIIEGCGDCIFVFDLERDIYEFSPKVFEILPVRSRIMQNGLETWLSFIVGGDRPIFENAINRIKAGETDQFKVQFRIKGSEGAPFWVALSGKCSKNDKGTPSLVAGSVINLGAMLNFGQLIDNVLNINKLSSLPNRVAFYQDLENAINAIKESDSGENNNDGKSRNNKSDFLIMVDIDGFTNINSLYGLSVGDRTLMVYGDILNLVLPTGAGLYHFSGNLFVIYLMDMVEDDARRFCARMKSATDGGILVDELHLRFTVSMGVAEFKRQDNIENVLLSVELALQKAKKTRNTVTFFAPEFREQHFMQVDMEQTLNDCIANNFRDFEVFYQPLYSVAYNMFLGAEALLRWRDSQGRIISPGTVIPALKNMGIFSKVESWVFRVAAAQCADWKSRFEKDLTININMSPQRAASGEVPDEIKEVLRQNGLTVSDIYLELTEDGVIMGGVLDIITQLNEMGVQIALDDFGSGYSSLGVLRNLPICEIKIDASFISDIETGSKSRNILKVLIDLAHTMNYVVCVEGVETLAQARILARMGADFLQGYYFSPPITAEEMEEEFLTKSNCPEISAKRHRAIWGDNPKMSIR
jgi:diguanylate cyclase (GGDEF)-like protein